MGQYGQGHRIHRRGRFRRKRRSGGHVRLRVAARAEMSAIENTLGVQMKPRVLLAILALFAAVQVPLTGLAGATTPRTSQTSQFGYWLITGWGTSYAFNAPYMGDPAAYGSDQ